MAAIVDILATISGNIDRMNERKGYDIVIVSTCDNEQENFWQNRLNGSKGSILPESSTVVAVHEDWPGGAGNGLGTLYALIKANEKAKSLYDLDVLKALSSGSSVALYHTAGKGTR
jgi:hypothetical protein